MPSMNWKPSIGIKFIFTQPRAEAHIDSDLLCIPTMEL